MTTSNPAWTAFFHQPRIAWFAIATQHPARGLVCANPDGTYQLYAWDVERGSLQQLTEQANGTTVGAIAADGETIYYLHDTQGGGIGHIFRMPFVGGLPQDLTPTLPAYMTFYISESHDGRMLGLHAVNQDGFQIYAFDAQGKRVFSYHNPALAVGPNVSHDGNMLVIATTEKTGEGSLSLEAYETASGTLLGELWDGAGTTIQPIGFIPQAGETRFLAASNQGGTLRPLIWNPRTGQRHDLIVPEIEGDVLPWDATTDGNALLLRQLHQAHYALWRYDFETTTATNLWEVPAGTLESAVLLPSGNLLALHQDSANPPRIIELDGTTGAVMRVALQLKAPPATQRWQSRTFAHQDGPIQAWLATPAGDPPYAMIVQVHSGPTDVQTDRFDPTSQAWLAAGFAFCSVNYRGSTSFGIEFEQAIHGQPGRLELRDCATVANALIGRNVARSDAIFIMGTAYGGYLALHALGQQPTLWAGAIAMAGIADWQAVYEAQDESLQAYQRRLFGGAPHDVPQVYREASPSAHVASVRAPALVIQGRDDPRTPHQQMERYIAAMRHHGKAITAHWFDASQPLTVEQRIQHQQWMIDFARGLI